MSSLLKLGMPPSVNQRKSWTFHRGLQGPDDLHPSQPPYFPADPQSAGSPVCSLSREHSHPSDQVGSCLRTLPWDFLLPGIYLANFLTSFKSLLTSLHDSEASSDYPFQHGYGPSTATHTVPVPSPHSFLSFHGTCGFPTPAVTNWWVD